jgi:Aminoglycoside-2''-adenylyltransferase
MSVLADRLLAVHDALSGAELPHAFGGAIALAYCTEEPRGTRDLDVNVFAEPRQAARVLAALPEAVVVRATDVVAAERDGQVRVWWEDTPIDVFLDVHRFHSEAAAGVRQVTFSGRTIPVLGCTALVVFKVLLDRTKDWADIEAVAQADAADVSAARAWVANILGPDDQAIRRLTALIG